MTQAISEAIDLLQSAKSLPPEQATGKVKDAVQLLLKSLQDQQGSDMDLDKGGGG